MTATETTTEMTMQVTAKTDGRRISELCSTRCAKNSLLPYPRPSGAEKRVCGLETTAYWSSV